MAPLRQYDTVSGLRFSKNDYSRKGSETRYTLLLWTGNLHIAGGNLATHQSPSHDSVFGASSQQAYLLLDIPPPTNLS